MNQCCYCFSNIPKNAKFCPKCGKERYTKRDDKQLAPGYVLVGRYTIGVVIGTGSFGITYRAFDTKFNSIVAVKEFFPERLAIRGSDLTTVIPSVETKEEFEYRKNRFFKEATDLANFRSHKNIPSVYEFFTLNNTVYIVMEYLEGMTLRNYLNQEKTVDKDFAGYVFREVGNALIAMHEAGIIHRDVSPDNIFICSDKELTVKLLDLGSAKLVNDKDGVIDLSVKDGYSPVEQYDASGVTDKSADVYSLAAVYYEMLTGQRLMRATDRLPKDPIRPVSSYDKSIPKNVNKAVMKALSVKQKDRYQNVNDFLNAASYTRKKRRMPKPLKIILIILAIPVSIFVTLAVALFIYVLI